MPRRRFSLRLHHSDSLVMLLAVLAASAFCLLVLLLSQRPAQPQVAFTIDVKAVSLSNTAAATLLREASHPTDRAVATLVSDDDGIRIGVTPRSNAPEDFVAAGKLAERIAEQLRTTDWSAAGHDAADRIAEQLYAIDVRIRDAAASGRGRRQEGEQRRLQRTLKVSRLLRERAEVLASAAVSEPVSAADAANIRESITVVTHPAPRDNRIGCALAVGLSALLATAAAVRVWNGRAACDPAARQRVGRSTETVRPLRDIAFGPPSESRTTTTHAA